MMARSTSESKSRAVIGIRPAIAAVCAILCRPRLWGTALGQWRRLTPRAWWKSAPFLPVPDQGYLRFRMMTQYGHDVAAIEPDAIAADVVTYLEWCRSAPVR